jgi:hypothetical protein
MDYPFNTKRKTGHDVPMSTGPCGLFRMLTAYHLSAILG